MVHSRHYFYYNPCLKFQHQYHVIKWLVSSFLLLERFHSYWHINVHLMGHLIKNMDKQAVKQSKILNGYYVTLALFLLLFVQICQVYCLVFQAAFYLIYSVFFAELLSMLLTAFTSVTNCWCGLSSLSPGLNSSTFFYLFWDFDHFNW